MKQQRLLTSVFMAAFLFSADCFAQDTEVPVPIYQATYSVGFGSLRAGTASFSLSKNADGTYTYKSLTKSAGLAALFLNDVVSETSHFEVMDGKLRPLQYTYEHTGKDKDNKETIQFDWAKGVAYTEEDGKQKSLPIKAGIYDRLLAQLAISMDLQAGLVVEDYPVLGHGEINVYHMLRQDNTDLKTPTGNYETVVIARRAPHKDRVTTFWLAPKLDYLLIQMEQTEPEKATISLTLTDIHISKQESDN
jgi:Protein of unknown function (DUF3108)